MAEVSLIINPKTIHAELEKMKPEMERALPQHVKAERLARIALTQLRMNPKLFSCTRESFFGALLTAAQLGLEPGVNGQCYLIPYKKGVKVNGQWQDRYICTLVPGWKGYIDLVARSERASVWTGAVRAGDFFEYQLGSNPSLEHKPGDKDTGAFTHVYAVGWIKGAQWPIIEVQSRAKVENHLAQYNKVGDDHYAKKDENNFEMYGRKIALLQVIKYLPSSVELREAAALDVTAFEGKQNLTIDMAMNHELEDGGEGVEDAEDLADVAAETAKIDALFTDLGTAGATATKQRAKYVGNNKGLIEWLEGQVAKKRNDGSGKQDAKKEPSAANPSATKSETATDTSSTQSKSQDTATNDNPDAEPANSLFEQQETSPATKSKPAPPPIDTEGWA